MRVQMMSGYIGGCRQHVYASIRSSFLVSSQQGNTRACVRAGDHIYMHRTEACVVTRFDAAGRVSLWLRRCRSLRSELMRRTQLVFVCSRTMDHRICFDIRIQQESTERPRSPCMHGRIRRSVSPSVVTKWGAAGTIVVSIFSCFL